MAVYQQLSIEQLSQSTANNTSQVRLLWTSTQTGSSYNLTRRTAYLYYSVNGKEEITVPVSYILPLQSTVSIIDLTLEVPHTSDGTASVSVRTWMDTHISAGVVRLNQSRDLDKIERSSSVSAPSGIIGSTVQIAVTRYNDLYTNTISLTFGSISGYLDATGNIVPQPVYLKSANIAFTIPETFYAEIPNSLSGSCVLGCSTYLDSTQIDNTQVSSFEVFVDEEVCKPILEYSIVDVNDQTIALTGSNSSFVQGYSTALCVVDAQANMNATISELWIDGVRIRAGNRLYMQSINQSSITMRVIDSRGLATERVHDLQIIPYSKVSLVARIERLDPTSGRAQLDLSGTVFSGSFGSSTNTLTIQYQLSSEEIHVLGTLEPTEDYYSLSSVIEDLDYRRVYNLDVTVSDKLSSISKSLTVKKGVPVFDWGENDFVFHVPVCVDVETPDLSAIKIGSLSLLDLMYPVGIIINSTSDANPFGSSGGTWIDVKTETDSEHRWQRIS